MGKAREYETRKCKRDVNASAEANPVWDMDFLSVVHTVLCPMQAGGIERSFFLTNPWHRNKPKILACKSFRSNSEPRSQAFRSGLFATNGLPPILELLGELWKTV